MSTPPILEDRKPEAGWHGWKYGTVNVLLVVHLTALLLMVASGGAGNYQSPPLIVRAATVTSPYVRFTGIQNAYRFFAPDPGPATVLWSRLVYEDGSVRWIESPGRESKKWLVPSALPPRFTVDSMTQNASHAAAAC